MASLTQSLQKTLCYVVFNTLTHYCHHIAKIEIFTYNFKPLTVVIYQFYPCHNTLIITYQTKIIVIGTQDWLLNVELMDQMLLDTINANYCINMNILSCLGHCRRHSREQL